MGRLLHAIGGGHIRGNIRYIIESPKSYFLSTPKVMLFVVGIMVGMINS